MAEDRQKRREAVAIKYVPGEQAAPTIIAKGKGVVADRILEIARENGIAVHEDPDLVEALSKLDLRQEIPPDLYKMIAELLMFVYRLNRKAIPLKKP